VLVCIDGVVPLITTAAFHQPATIAASWAGGDQVMAHCSPPRHMSFKLTFWASFTKSAVAGTRCRNWPQLAGECVALHQPSPKGLTNCGRFLKMFTNAKRPMNMDLFTSLSKNRFMIVVLVEHLFTNHKRVPSVLEQWHSIGSQNRFTICGLFCKRTMKKSVHKKDHNYELIIKNRFMNNRFTNGFLIEHACVLQVGPLRQVPDGSGTLPANASVQFVTFGAWHRHGCHLSC